MLQDEDGWKTARMVPTSMEVEEKPMLYGEESTVELRILSFGRLQTMIVDTRKNDICLK